MQLTEAQARDIHKNAGTSMNEKKIRVAESMRKLIF